ncbi:TRMT10C [Branchiostoma lanceolatum]|uniref:tRNA methyltransferase 10 homolog C n=1 Tax=Branchiostoma lanceolatum TaxID=7740 RepID=A0A8K0ESH2_BRALA|nr:TRMT10C [Branchiostoma lanceolatum]
MLLSRVSRAALGQTARVLNRDYSQHSRPFLLQSHFRHQHQGMSSPSKCGVHLWTKKEPFPQQLTSCVVHRCYSSKSTDGRNGSDEIQQTDNTASKDTSSTSNSPSSTSQSDTVPTEETMDDEDVLAPRAPEIFKELSELDSLDLSPEEKEWKRAQLELELMFERFDVEKVTITDRHIEQFMGLQTNKARQKFVDYMIKTEYKKRSFAEKKAAKQQRRKELLEGPVPKSTTFQPMIWGRKMELFYGWNQARNMMFGSDLVFDFSYEDEMQFREKINLCDQLNEALGANRQDTEPFHMHLVNLRHDGQTYKELARSRTDENFADKILGTVTEKSYLDLFPRERLVYLTADSPRELTKFEPDKVYIIGALVDRKLTTNLSYAKVKREGIASAALPLDRYLWWGLGDKVMTLDQMMKIMLTLKNTNDFEAALRHVPTRKHHGLRSELAKKQIRPGMGGNKFQHQRRGQRMRYEREERDAFPRVDRRKAKAWFED